MVRLGVNIDHVATVRQARKESFPDPVRVSREAIAGGADGITAHLREDRRHIQDHDIERLKNDLSVPLNLEMALNPGVIEVALRVRPAWCCVVPENRRELTTEGGLDLNSVRGALKEVLPAFHSKGIRISLFLEPDVKMIETAKRAGADAVEIHTGAFARAAGVQKNSHEACSGTNLSLRSAMDHELLKIVKAAEAARRCGLVVNAGHGLDYGNIGPLAQSFEFDEYNIGFAIVARSLETGMKSAVAEMKNLIGKTTCVES